MNRVASVALGLGMLALFTTACSAHDAPAAQSDVAPGGSGGERRFAVTGFDSVGLSGAANADIRVGPGFSVVATGTPAALDKLRVRKKGSGLDLGLKRGVSLLRGERVHFTITMPRIAAASIGGSGSITVDRVPEGAFEGNIGGSGTLVVRGMNVSSASFNIGGSGDVTATGRARRTAISIGGSGDIHNAGLVAEQAEVTLAGAGDVAANATRSAQVTLVGSGNVTITGGAKCEVTKMGSGSVRCG